VKAFLVQVATVTMVVEPFVVDQVVLKPFLAVVAAVVAVRSIVGVVMVRPIHDEAVVMVQSSKLPHTDHLNPFQKLYLP